jgi:hypothetical protein
MMARLDAIVLPICHSGGRDYDRNHPIFIMGELSR